MEMMFRNLPIKTILLWGASMFSSTFMSPCSEKKHDLLRDKEKYNEHFCKLMKMVIGNMINAFKE